eukprot:4718696-Amphidinium_carterae.1
MPEQGCCCLVFLCLVNSMFAPKEASAMLQGDFQTTRDAAASCFCVWSIEFHNFQCAIDV